MRYLIILLGAVLALLAIMSVDPAAAQRHRTICRGGNDADWFSVVTGARSCVRVRPRHHRPRYYYDDGRHGSVHYHGRPQVRGYVRYDDEGYSRRERQCQHLVTVKGSEALTEDGALKIAKRMWRLTVRSDFGEIYQDLNHARDRFGDQGAEYRCWRSSTNESALGKLGEFLPGGYRKRCQVWAVPCLGKRFKVKDDKDDMD
jgi:hypothetical protein